MLRLMQLRLAVGLFVAGILALTTVCAWAFSQQTVSPNGGNYDFGDPDKHSPIRTITIPVKTPDHSVRMVRWCSSASSRARSVRLVGATAITVLRIPIISR